MIPFQVLHSSFAFRLVWFGNYMEEGVPWVSQPSLLAVEIQSHLISAVWFFPSSGSSPGYFLRKGGQGYGIYVCRLTLWASHVVVCGVSRVSLDRVR